MPDPLASIPLSAIRVFEAAARQRSFTRAADELGISQAAVSWQVKSLERRLGQVLFDRLPKEVALTSPGERLARAATDALGVLRTAISDLADAGESVLVLTTTGSFATLWLAPRIGSFQITHPNIAVSLDATARRIDLMRENVDAAVRPGSGDWPDQESVYLFPAAITPLCTPEFARRHGLARPEDLLGAPRIGLAEDWSAWFEAAGAKMVDAPAAPSVVAKQQSFEVASALSGRVAALASRIYFAAEVSAGRLIQPFETMLYHDRAYWLTYRKDRRRAAKIIAFRDWLLAAIADDPAVAGSSGPLTPTSLGEAN
jgi:LysR family transcriptional regulator, glycine cleavage system transcriptional activator